jgi:hypothetical protein
MEQPMCLRKSPAAERIGCKAGQCVAARLGDSRPQVGTAGTGGTGVDS